MFNPLGFSPTPRYPLPRQMAVESKPLFHPEVMRQQVRSFNLPDHTDAWQPRLKHWASSIGWPRPKPGSRSKSASWPTARCPWERSALPAIGPPATTGGVGSEEPNTLNDPALYFRSASVSLDL